MVVGATGERFYKLRSSERDGGGGTKPSQAGTVGGAAGWSCVECYVDGGGVALALLLFPIRANKAGISIYISCHISPRMDLRI